MFFDNINIDGIENTFENFDTNTCGTSEQRNLGGAGLNKETISLTVNAFKKFCLKAGTKKADEIHDYYPALRNRVLTDVHTNNYHWIFNKEVCH